MALYDMTKFQVANIFVYVILEGTTVGGNPVSAALKPTTNLDTIWPEAACCTDLSFKPEFKEYEHAHPLQTGGSHVEQIRSLIRDTMTASFGEDSALHRMFGFGTPTLPTVGSNSSKPFSDRVRQRKGWCQFIGVGLDGTRLFAMDAWCRIRQTDGYKFGDVVKPGLEFVNLGHETVLDGVQFFS